MDIIKEVSVSASRKPHEKRKIDQWERFIRKDVSREGIRELVGRLEVSYIYYLPNWRRGCKGCRLIRFTGSISTSPRKKPLLIILPLPL